MKMNLLKFKIVPRKILSDMEIKDFMIIRYYIEGCVISPIRYNGSAYYDNIERINKIELMGQKDNIDEKIWCKIISHEIIHLTINKMYLEYNDLDMYNCAHSEDLINKLNDEKNKNNFFISKELEKYAKYQYAMRYGFLHFIF